MGSIKSVQSRERDSISMFKAVINPSRFVLGLKNGCIDMKKMVSMGKREPQRTWVELRISLPWGKRRNVSRWAMWTSSTRLFEFFVSLVPSLNTCYCKVCNIHLITENQQSTQPSMYYSHFRDKETCLMLYTLSMTKLGRNQPPGSPVYKSVLLSITQPYRYVCTHWEHWCHYTTILCTLPIPCSPSHLQVIWFPTWLS